MSDELPNELIRTLYHGREEQNIEYKGDIPWTDKDKQADIIKTIFSLANEQDGGTIVIGVHDNGSFLGLSDANFLTYSHDRINQKLENKANQTIVCTITKAKEFEDKRTATKYNFIFIQVRKTSEYPAIYTGENVKADEAKEEYLSNLLLRKGALYIRCKTKIGNKEIQDVHEWKEVIETILQKYKSETERRYSLIHPITEMLGKNISSKHASEIDPYNDEKDI